MSAMTNVSSSACSPGGSALGSAARISSIRPSVGSSGPPGAMAQIMQPHHPHGSVEHPGWIASADVDDLALAADLVREAGTLAALMLADGLTVQHNTSMS